MRGSKRRGGEGEARRAGGGGGGGGGIWLEREREGVEQGCKLPLCPSPVNPKSASSSLHVRRRPCWQLPARLVHHVVPQVVLVGQLVELHQCLPLRGPCHHTGEGSKKCKHVGSGAMCRFGGGPRRMHASRGDRATKRRTTSHSTATQPPPPPAHSRGSGARPRRRSSRRRDHQGRRCGCRRRRLQEAVGHSTARRSAWACREDAAITPQACTNCSACTARQAAGLERQQVHATRRWEGQVQVRAGGPDAPCSPPASQWPLPDTRARCQQESSAPTVDGGAAVLQRHPGDVAEGRYRQILVRILVQVAVAVQQPSAGRGHTCPQAPAPEVKVTCLPARDAPMQSAGADGEQAAVLRAGQAASPLTTRCSRARRPGP